MLIELLTTLFGYAADTRYLSPAPLYHAAPLRHSMVTIKMGGTAYIMDRFDAKGALELIERYKITHSQWVPTMFVRLLKLPMADRLAFDLGSMEMAVHAAAPCPHDIKRQMIDWWGPIIHEYYAGTENNGFTAITSTEWLAHPGSVGRAKLGQLHICDEEGHELPIGQTGEVYFENGHQFSYHKDPEKTAACTNAKGWTTLGDIGHLDGEGYLYLTDRKSFVIISGGVNIYPQETEDVLLLHPAVLDTAVIGVPNEDFGEEVKAIVQLLPSVASSDALAQSLIDHCRQHLSPIKCPRSIDFKDQLPRSATGKLYKRRLRDHYWNR
jgi:acyl-CoA synthetase (AMP-forming)/AMP-acid ligase II